MTQYFVIDRIENEILVVIAQQDPNVSFELPQSIFPEVSEGDILALTPNASSRESALSEANARLERLKSASPQPSAGDIIDL